MTNEEKKTDDITSKPLDPALDYEEYVGGETDSRTGVTRDFTRSENEATKEKSISVVKDE